MAIIKGWDFGKQHGFTGSASADKVPVRAHERSVQHFAKGGKVEGKNSSPPARPQKHYDRMENFRKERDVEPASPAKDTAKMARGGKMKRIKKANGGKIDLADNKKLNHQSGDGSGTVVAALKKGGKAKSKPKSGGSSAKKAAGALAQIAAMASQGAPAGGAPPQIGAPMGAAPPQMPPGIGGPPGMRRGGKAKHKKK